MYWQPTPRSANRIYPGGVDNRAEVNAFLSSRRAKIAPEQAGLAHYNHNRRVPGLRRSEVADLAGVSVEYLLTARTRQPQRRVVRRARRALPGAATR